MTSRPMAGSDGAVLPGGAGWWQGLAPIDVGATAGRQTLAVRARATDGRTLERAYPITIAARTFPARRHHRRRRNSSIRRRMSWRGSKRSGRPSRRSSPRPTRERLWSRAVRRAGSRHRHEQFRPAHHPQWPAARPAHRNRLPGRDGHAGRRAQSRAHRARRRSVLSGEARSSSTTGSACTPTSRTCRSSPSRKARWSSAASGSGCPARPAASPARTCTGRCASAARASIRCRWWRCWRGQEHAEDAESVSGATGHLREGEAATEARHPSAGAGLVSHFEPAMPPGQLTCMLRAQL